MTRRVSSGEYKPIEELEFHVQDERCFIITESERTGCTFELEEAIQRSNGNVIVFLTVRGGDFDRVLTDAMEWPTIQDARIVLQNDDTSLFDLIVGPKGLAATVSDSRAIPRTVTADRGVARVVIAVPPGIDPQCVIELFRTRHPDSELVARRQQDIGPLFPRWGFNELVLDRLTEKQRETLITAYVNGYFERPRTTTAADCADLLGISQSTFSQHLSVGLKKVLQSLLENRYEFDETGVAQE